MDSEGVASQVVAGLDGYTANGQRGDKGNHAIVGELVRLDRVKRRPVTWVWESRIPAGMTTLMAGRAGCGKTALTGWVMARLTQGQLSGAWHARPAHVVYIGAEDDPESVIAPRLYAAGADPKRVHLHSAPTTVDAASIHELAEAIRELDDVALVIFDPLDAHLGARVDTHKKADVQRSIAELHAALTEHHHCCGVLGLAHLSKRDSEDLMAKVIGSVGFTSAARSLLGIGEHPEEQRDRVCVQAKPNMAAEDAAPALRFRIETAITTSDDGLPIETAGVVILGEEYGIDPASILRVSNAEDRTKRNETREWIVDVLAGGEPHPYRQIERLARDDGIERSLLHRARQELGDRVVIERDESARGRPSTWRLVSSHGGFVAPAARVDATKSNPDEIRGSGPSKGVSSHVAHTSDGDTKPAPESDIDDLLPVARPLRQGELTDQERDAVIDRLDRKGEEGRRRFGEIDPRADRFRDSWGRPREVLDDEAWSK